LKKDNNIDKIFESKLNTQSFELKEAYLADFEMKLDAYNKKKRRFFWLFFGSLISIAVFFYFTIPTPKSNEPDHQMKSTVIGPESTSSKNTHSGNVTTSNHSVSTEENSTIDTVIKESYNSQIPSKNEATTVQKKTQLRPIKTRNETKTIPLENTIFQTNEPNLPLDNENTNTNTIIEIIMPPDVFIDDTIRRQVIVVDTIVKRNTIIINDTIKKKVRLFKKKR